MSASGELPPAEDGSAKSSGRDRLVDAASAGSETRAERWAKSSGRDWLADLERLLVWTGERLNPILVKEARQSLKSRQFVITFGLLLLCGWAWSVLGLALMGPEAAYTGEARRCLRATW